MSDKLEKLIENFFTNKENILTIEKLKEEITLQYLTEKQGVMRYKKGDRFVSKEDSSSEYFIDEIILLPNDGTAKFNSKEDASKAVADTAKEKNLMLHEINRPAPAAMMVILSDNKKKLHAYVRYFRELKLNPLGHDMWLTPAFIDDTGLEQSIAGEKITASQSERLEIKPKNIVGDEIPRNAAELQAHCLSNIEKLAIDSIVKTHITALLDAAVNNKPSPILKGGAKYAKSYNKYLGEILAPISLLSGWICKGDREDSQIIINKTEKIVKRYSPDMAIAFNDSVTEELVDSTVYDDGGLSVQISSKAGGGAPASLLGPSKILEDMKTKKTVVNKKSTSQYQIFVDKYPYVKEILEIAGNKKISSYQAPVILASKMGLINSEEISLLENILQERKITLQAFNQKYLQAILSSPSLSEAWNRMIPKKQEVFIPMNRLISGLAKLCADQINNETDQALKQKYKFNEAMKELLSFGMIQMNSYIKNVGKEDCQFTEFVVKYPPVFKGRILLDADKSYTSTKITGQFGFKIP